MVPVILFACALVAGLTKTAKPLPHAGSRALQVLLSLQAVLVPAIAHGPLIARRVSYRVYMGHSMLGAAYAHANPVMAVLTAA